MDAHFITSILKIVALDLVLSGDNAVVIGMAANRCFETGQLVRIKDLVPGLSDPTYAPMPSSDASVPMPGSASA